MEDAGALPIELDVSNMNMGDVIELRPYDGEALKDGKVIAKFQVKSDVLFDEVRAGGRIPLIVGRGLTAKARAALGLPASTEFRLPISQTRPTARCKEGRLGYWQGIGIHEGSTAYTRSRNNTYMSENGNFHDAIPAEGRQPEPFGKLPVGGREVVLLVPFPFFQHQYFVAFF
jgi:hypothetical protein